MFIIMLFYLSFMIFAKKKNQKIFYFFSSLYFFNASHPLNCMDVL